MPSEMKRLRQLDQENCRLKKLVADLSLDKEMLQDLEVRSLPVIALGGGWAAARSPSRAQRKALIFVESFMYGRGPLQRSNFNWTRCSNVPSDTAIEAVRYTAR